MQQREKILAFALAAVVAIWFGFPIVNGWFFEPIQELSSKEDRLLKESNEKFDEQIELRKKQKQLAQWRKISLPPDPLDAQRLYQEWLTDLAQLSGFEDVKITLERKTLQGDIYVTIPVTLDAKATLQELAQFLEQFESVNLLHRVATCDVISPTSEGNPDLEVSLTAEGLSIIKAPERSRLFPQIELSADLKKEQTLIEVPATATGFPDETPFRVRIDDEFTTVTKVDGQKWTLRRGVSKTFSEDHPDGTTLELFPTVVSSQSETKVATNATVAMWSKSLFTKPAPQANYDPKLAATTAPAAVRGTKWDWKLNVSSWDPAFGSPLFSMLESPKGMKLDERTGSLSWDVKPELELGEREIQVMVWGSASKKAGFTSTVSLRVRDPNEPPEIKQDGPIKFFLGRSSEKKLDAIDPDGDDDKLKFSIEGAPEGMQIGENDGIIRWIPAESLDAATLEIKVTITDSDQDAEVITKTLAVSLEEDSARYTYLTTTLKRAFGDGEEEWEAYLFDRATNKTTKLRVEDEVTITDFEMTIKEIGDDFVNVQRPDGQYRIVFERPLVEMVKLPTPPTPSEPAGTSEEPTTESPAETPVIKTDGVSETALPPTADSTESPEPKSQDRPKNNASEADEKT